MDTKDYKDITNVLKAVKEIDIVQPPIPEASNEEAAILAAAVAQSPSTNERPSTSTAHARRGSRSPVAISRVVPTLDPSLSTPHPSPSPTILSLTPHPSLTPNFPLPTPHPCPRFDIRPPTPRSFPELSPILSFDLGIDPTPLDM